MKFSTDYESMLLLVSLLLSLGAYQLRRLAFTRRGKQEETAAEPEEQPPSLSRENEPLKQVLPEPKPKPELESFPLKGLLKKKENIFLVSILAWLLFALYIIISVSRYIDGYYEKQQLVTDLLFLLAVPYFAYHEYICWKNKADYGGMRLINGVFAMSVLVFVTVYSLPKLSEAVIYLSSYQTAASLTFLGYPTEASPVDFAANNGFIRENDLFISSEILKTGQDHLVDINLTCSAFPSHVVFLALALMSNRSLRERGRALLVIPLVHFLNVLRLMALVYVLYEGKINYFIAHDVLARIFSLIAFYFILSWFFRVLPDVHRDVLSALYIGKRHRIRPQTSLTEPDEDAAGGT